MENVKDFLVGFAIVGTIVSVLGIIGYNWGADAIFITVLSVCISFVCLTLGGAVRHILRTR